MSAVPPVRHGADPWKQYAIMRASEILTPFVRACLQALENQRKIYGYGPANAQTRRLQEISSFAENMVRQLQSDLEGYPFAEHMIDDFAEKARELQEQAVEATKIDSQARPPINLTGLWDIIDRMRVKWPATVDQAEDGYRAALAQNVEGASR